MHGHRKGGRCPRRELLEDFAEARPRALQAEDPALLDRFHDMVLPPGDFTAATREPDSVSHEHHTIFFQTLGVTPLTLPISVGGVAAASKRPFLFSGSTSCVSTSFLLRGARKRHVPISRIATLEGSRGLVPTFEYPDPTFRIEN
jgi:hypothetical protein